MYSNSQFNQKKSIFSQTVTCYHEQANISIAIANETNSEIQTDKWISVILAQIIMNTDFISQYSLLDRYIHNVVSFITLILINKNVL